MLEATENANMAENYFSGQNGFPKDYFLAFKYALKGAEGGDSDAQFRTALMYNVGIGTKPDINEAHRWYKLSADQNNAEACLNLAIMYDNGNEIIPQNLEYAFSYFKKSADLGSHVAKYALGRCYWFGFGTDININLADECFSRAFSYYKKRHDDGIATDEEIYRLAQMYENGYGTVNSDEMAMPLYKESAEQAYVHSLDKLGSFYEDGRGGLKTDYGEALRLYTISSQQGSREAYYHIGLLYSLGKGVVADNAKAAEYFEESVNRGYYPAVKLLAEMYLVGYGIPQDIKKALKLYEDGINKGVPTYMHDVALWYLEGKGVVKDKAKALGLLTNAAKQDHIASLNKLGDIYFSGNYGFTKDYSASFNFYYKAVQLGDTEGCFYLGYMYHLGHGVDKNIAEAIEHYKRANSPIADNNLAKIYENGDGIAKDLGKAVELYTKSSEAGNAVATINLAILYRDGIYFRQDMKKAIALYEKAAKQETKYQ